MEYHFEILNLIPPHPGRRINCWLYTLPPLQGRGMRISSLYEEQWHCSIIDDSSLIRKKGRMNQKKEK